LAPNYVLPLHLGDQVKPHLLFDSQSSQVILKFMPLIYLPIPLLQFQHLYVFHLLRHLVPVIRVILTFPLSFPIHHLPHPSFPVMGPLIVIQV